MGIDETRKAIEKLVEDRGNLPRIYGLLCQGLIQKISCI